MQPPVLRVNCPAFSASVWAFVISSGRPGEGVAFPPLPSRLTMSPGCLSREFCAVFPAGRKNRTNWRHFSYRQENLSRGSPIFNPFSAPAPRPARREKCRNSRAPSARKRMANASCRSFWVMAGLLPSLECCLRAGALHTCTPRLMPPAGGRESEDAEFPARRLARGRRRWRPC